MSLISKILIFLTSLTGTIWFGAYVSRLFLTYNFFTPPTIILRPELSQINLAPIFLIILPVVNVTTVSYLAFLALLVATILAIRPSIRNNGWLFITLAIIAITSPFEIYLIYTYDLSYFTSAQNQVVNAPVLYDLLVKRLDKFSGFPIIQICCYASILFLAIYQPLTRTIAKNED